MVDVRTAIDDLDREIVRLLGQRFAYVKAAARFKTSEHSVRAPDRFAAVLKKRREWAEVEGLDPDAIDKMYRDLIEHFIAEEMKDWRARAAT